MNDVFLVAECRPPSSADALLFFAVTCVYVSWIGSNPFQRSSDEERTKNRKKKPARMIRRRKRKDGNAEENRSSKLSRDGKFRKETFIVPEK